MNCPKCGRELLETEKFCIGCGTPVTAAAQPELSAPEPEPALPTAVRCDSCGEELTTDDRFCQSCGAQVGGPAITEGPASRLTEPVEADFEGVDAPDVQPVASPTAVSPPPGKSSNSTIYSLLGLAFVLIACAYFAYDYFSTPRSPGLATIPGEEIELAHEGTASAPSSDARDLQSQRRLDEAAPSGTTAPAAPRLDPQSPSTPRKPAASSPQPTSPGTAQQTSPDTSQAEAAGRLNLPRTPPGIAPTTSATPPASPGAVQQTSPDTSQEEAAGRLNLPPTPPGVVAPAASPPPRAPSGEVLMPGGKARKRAEPPARASAAPVKPPPAAPAPKPPAQKGTIYWTGKLQKNQVIVIEKGEATAGIADGDHFTGIPIDVHLPSPAVRLVERPTAQNNWNRVAFRCLRTTKQSVTINIQWNLLR